MSKRRANRASTHTAHPGSPEIAPPACSSLVSEELVVLAHPASDIVFSTKAVISSVLGMPPGEKDLNKKLFSTLPAHPMNRAGIFLPILQVSFLIDSSIS